MPSLPPPLPQSAATPAKSGGVLKIALIGGGIVAAMMFLCCGGLVVVGVTNQQSISAKVRDADAKWFAGDKAKAVAEYRALAANHPTSLGTRLTTIYGRIIDFQFESGDAEGGKRSIAEARSKNVVPTFESAAAKAAFESEPVAVAAPKNSSAVLTAEFFPIKKGKLFQMMGTVSIQNTTGMQHRKEYEFKSAEKLQVTWRSNFLTSNRKDLPLPSPQTIHVRNGTEFIELGNESSLTKQITWSRLVKKNAKVGETWEFEPMPGIHRAYKFVAIEPREVNDTPGVTDHRKVPCAIIEMTETTTLASSQLVNVEETVLGLGVGFVKRTSWRLENGERQRNWSEWISPTMKD